MRGEDGRLGFPIHTDDVSSFLSKREDGQEKQKMEEEEEVIVKRQGRWWCSGHTHTHTQ